MAATDRPSARGRQSSRRDTCLGRFGQIRPTASLDVAVAVAVAVAVVFCGLATPCSAGPRDARRLAVAPAYLVAPGLLRRPDSSPADAAPALQALQALGSSRAKRPSWSTAHAYSPPLTEDELTKVVNDLVPPEWVSLMRFGR
ncbi:unnamed protein product [Protopolystoma xenopodis]|uniref:Uncharacterized protein n=1 Tax=Protopolystoma xenopodis TaxID=117903 RepID=A0A448X6L7_9PLAT|nr:unnamed protein product [Protopolystoma xenopodis]